MFVLECNIILREDHQVTHITPSPTQVEVEEDGGSILLSPHSYAIGKFFWPVLGGFLDLVIK